MKEKKVLRKLEVQFRYVNEGSSVNADREKLTFNKMQ